MVQNNRSLPPGEIENNDSKDEFSKNRTLETHNEPTYNLKAVVQETGLKADTLRAWERRYGLPHPTRTPSGHRLYSKRDIGILKWLLSRQGEGLSISRAVALWQRLVDDGIDPIDASDFGSSHFEIGAQQQPSTQTATPLTDLKNRNGDAPSTSTEASSSGSHIADFRRDWVSACLNFDETRAEQIATQAFSLFDPEAVCVELYFKGISEIGEGWLQGRVTAQQEHFASSLATRRLHALLNGTPPPTRTGKVLIGCPSGEAHVFASNLIALSLRRHGWPVLLLGANIPVKDLHDTVKVTAPTLVILTAQQLHTAASLLEMGNVLFDAGTPLAYGGSVFMQFPELQRCIPGHYLGNDIASVPDIVEQLMSAPRVKPAQRSIPAEYADGLVSYRKYRAEIEQQVWRTMESYGADRQVVHNANRCISQIITAALSLCKVSATELELDDIGILLLNHYGMPADLIDRYLDTYYVATLQHCQDVSTVVAEWLETLLGKYYTV